MKALFNGKMPKNISSDPIHPEIFTGTSVGSYNASFLVGQWEAYGASAIANLEKVWIDEIAEGSQNGGNGCYRFRGNPAQLLDPGYLASHPMEPIINLINDSASLSWDALRRAVYFATAAGETLPQRIMELFNLSSFISREPLEQLVRKTIRFEDIRSSSRLLRLAATNWALGEVEIFNNLDMTDQLGPLVILASTAIPGFFSRTAIGSQPYVDGGVVMNTPLKPAVDAGADTLHVIYMDPDVKKIHIAEIENTVTTMYRMQVIGWAKAINGDIDSARRTNRESAFARLAMKARGVLEKTLKKQEMSGTEAKEFFTEINLSEIDGHLKRSSQYRAVTIHRYHPHDDLGGPLGLLDFDRGKIQGLIERGFKDTVTHDCEDSGCVIPIHADKAADIAEGVKEAV